MPQAKSQQQTAGSAPPTAIIELSPEDEMMVSEYAQTHDVNRATALRKLLTFAKIGEDRPTKPTLLTRSMQVIDDAKSIGLAGQDPNDALNIMGRSVAIKTLGKELLEDKGGGGKATIEDIKELMYLRILERMAGGGGGDDSLVQKITDQNREQREFYEKKLSDLEGRIKDMAMEKKIQNLEGAQQEAIAGMSRQLEDIGQRVEMYRNIPANPTKEEKQDAVSHLESIAGEVERVKNAFSKLGFIPQGTGAGAAQGEGSDKYRKSDGSTDYVLFVGDKIENTIQALSGAWQKKTPERKSIEDTPAPAPSAGGRDDDLTVQFTHRMSPEEYYTFLKSKPSLTPNEQEFTAQFESYVASKEKPHTPLEVEKAAPAAEHLAPTCIKCGIYPPAEMGYCKDCWNEMHPEKEQEKTGE